MNCDDLDAPARHAPGRCPETLHFEVLNLRGPDCLECIVAALHALAPGMRVDVDLDGGRLSVASTLTPRDIETALSSLGYPTHLDPARSR